ncbi:MAG: hypothetical protein C4527_09355 [Candidatus Omnitrophota bacterium]|jgi:hypothetical protein|nr:MAG: hypothetical protein C4527_09355 [Candidatus Omnitrophota bacterium]
MDILPVFDNHAEHLHSSRSHRNFNSHNDESIRSQEDEPKNPATVSDSVTLSERISVVESHNQLEEIVVAEDGRYSLSLRMQAQMESHTSIGWVEEETAENFSEMFSSAREAVNSLSDERITRINNQMRDLFGGNFITASVPSNQESLSTDAGEASGELSFQLDPTLQKYLQLIRSLSKDTEALDRFLDQIDANLENGSDAGISLDGILAEFSQTGAGNTVSVSSQSIEANFMLKIAAAAGGGMESLQRITAMVSEEMQMQQADPLVFDLDGDGIELTSAAEGVSFAIDGTGIRRQTAFVTGGDAFLALDRNGNGMIDSGLELFGDQHGARDGLEELRKFDDNRDGIIDASDSVFSQLRLFADANMDGLSQAHELKTLRELGIVAIFLDGQDRNEIIAGGNQLTKTTSFLRSDGSTGLAGDVNLNYFLY